MTSSHSAATTPDFSAAFHVLDADRDGRIGYDDLKAFYGPRVDEDAIGAMMSAADTDKNGYVEYGEFEHVLSGQGGRYGSAGPDGVMGEVFKMMDRDGDGLLSSNDLRGYLAGAGLGASDEEVHAMMGLADGDGGVTFDGLLRILGFSKKA
ncbi:hypothetical protein MLD38_020579 [Melastoma candidum]|uniref:Uncharacterized protein n=1 Tax=Melastoma candidum TaxID=119954 RepID=A0ACB9QF96_9MYRT|nr:hypothetical protein MLD38_020579 [Melastoma candidum]